MTAGNASENNALFTIAAIVTGVLVAMEAADKVLIAKDMVNLAQAIDAGDDDRAAELASDLAIEGGIEMLGGNIVPGSTMATKIFLALKRKGAASSLIKKVKKLFGGSTQRLNQAPSMVDALKLKTELTLKEANILGNDGKLTASVIEKAEEIKLKNGAIKNPSVVKQLTQDGSEITDWAKFRTRSVPGPNGSKLQVHFYKNRVTGKVDYDTPDFKVKDVVPAVPKKPVPEPNSSTGPGSPQ